MESLVSIIIPIYNTEKYLEKCLESIRVQSYTNFEVLLINDGSSDSSEDICLYYTNLDKRFVCYSHLNQGNAYSRNKGIDLCNGKFIIFVDSDDWISENFIEKCIQNSTNVDLVCFSFFKEYENYSIKRTFDVEGTLKGFDFRRRSLGLIDGELCDPSQLDSLSTMWGKFYKADIIKNNLLVVRGLKEIGTWEDGLFNWAYSKYCSSVKVINEPLYHYRKTNNFSITSSYISNYLDKFTNLFKILENDISRDHLDTIFHISLYNRIALSIIGLGLNETSSGLPFFEKVKKFKNILNSPLHSSSLSKLKLNYFPLHWRVFFYLAKNNYSFLSFLIIICIKRIIKSKQ